MTQLNSRTGKYSGLWIDGPKHVRASGIRSRVRGNKRMGDLPECSTIEPVRCSRGAAVRHTEAGNSSRLLAAGHVHGPQRGDPQGERRKIQELADLDKPGVTIATVLGTSGHEYMKQNFKNATIRALDTGDLTQDSLEVLAGRADAALQDAFKIAQVAAGIMPTVCSTCSVTNHSTYSLSLTRSGVAIRNSCSLSTHRLNGWSSAGKWQETEKAQSRAARGRLLRRALLLSPSADQPLKLSEPTRRRVDYDKLMYGGGQVPLLRRSRLALLCKSGLGCMDDRWIIRTELTLLPMSFILL